MASDNTLSFAVAAVNDASKAMRDVAGDLEMVEDAAADAQAKAKDLDTTWDRLQEGVDELGNSLDTLSEKIDPKGNGVQAAADAFGNMERVLTGVKDVVGVVEEQFGVSLGPMEDYVGAAADVAGGLEGIIGGGAELVKQFGPMVAGIAPVIASTWAHVAALGAQAAAFIAANAPMLIIIGTIALVAGGVFLLIKHWDSIVEKVPGLKAAMDGVMSFFTGTVVPAFGAVSGAMQKVIDFVMNNWPLIASLVLLPFAPLILLATDAFGIRSKLEGAFQAVLDFARDTWGTIKGFVTGPFEELLESAKGAFGVKDAILGAFQAIPAGVTAAMSGLWDIIRGIVNPIISAYNNTIGRIPGAPSIPNFDGAGGGVVNTPASNASNPREPGYRPTYGGVPLGQSSGGPYAGGPESLVMGPSGLNYIGGTWYGANAYGSDAGPGTQHRTYGLAPEPQVINLVVDGDVLAKVVNGRNDRLSFA